MKKLTLRSLKAAKFSMVMHLNRDKEHDLVNGNAEYGLAVTQTTRMKDYKIVRRILHTTVCDAEADLLAKDRDNELRAFIEKYNAAIDARKEKSG